MSELLLELRAQASYTAGQDVDCSFRLSAASWGIFQSLLYQQLGLRSPTLYNYYGNNYYWSILWYMSANICPACMVCTPFTVIYSLRLHPQEYLVHSCTLQQHLEYHSHTHPAKTNGTTLILTLCSIFHGH